MVTIGTSAANVQGIRLCFITGILPKMHRGLKPISPGIRKKKESRMAPASIGSPDTIWISLIRHQQKDRKGLFSDNKRAGM